MMGRRPTNASYTQIAPKERQAKALELRKAGLTYQQIADTLGYGSISAAEKAIKSGLKTLIREPAEELRALMVEQHRTLLRAIWPLALKGSLPHIDRAMRLLAAIANLEGIVAPPQINIALIVQRAADALDLTEDERAQLHDDVASFVAAQKAVSA